jgi:hypothetical protein
VNRRVMLATILSSSNVRYQATITPTVGAELSGNIPLTVDEWWTKNGNWTIGAGIATHTASAANDALSRAATLTVGSWYRFAWDIAARTAGFAWAGVGSPSGQSARSTVGSFIDIGRTTSTTLAFFGHTSFAGSIDNLSCKQITLASCFATPRQTPAGDVIAEASVDCVPGSQIGVAVNIDNAANPLNMVSCYINGVSIFLDKRVAGTASTVFSAAITYGAGKKVRVEKSGTTYKVFYDGVQIGADQTIADAGIIGNTLHMQFATYEGNRFYSWSALPN